MASRYLKTSDFISNFKELNLDLHGVRLPSFEIEKADKRKLEVSEDLNNYDFLRAACLQGFKKLDLEKDSEIYNQYVDRIKYELKTLKDLGFIDYVLLVWDVINFCKKRKHSNWSRKRISSREHSPLFDWGDEN